LCLKIFKSFELEYNWYNAYQADGHTYADIRHTWNVES
jgi:hypothetical protein